MFPVCTGINRADDPIFAVVLYVPCMHRDKPVTADECIGGFECSLYAQGTVLDITASVGTGMFPVYTWLNLGGLMIDSAVADSLDDEIEEFTNWNIR